MHRCAYGLLLLLVGSISALEAKMAAKKVAAVIGYGPGIGHSCAALWASKGYAVALVCRTASKLETGSKKIPNSQGFQCDITDNAALAATMKSIADNLGPVDTLLYNAGNGVWKRFDEITVEQLDMAMKTNVYGLLTCAQCCTPAMVEKGGGNIIVTGATASLRGMPFTSAFAAAKGGQKSLAQSMARQLWKDNVHVAYAIIDAAVGDGEGKMHPDSIAREYFHLAEQTPDCWSFQHHIQCKTSDMSLL